MDNVKVGDTVEFIGFVGDDTPENGELLEIGNTYEVTGVNDETPEDVLYELAAPNPKKGKRGQKDTVPVQIFFDECTLTAGEEPAEEVAEEEVVEDVPEEVDTVDAGEDDFVEPAEAEVGVEYEVQMKDVEIPVFIGTVTKATKTLLYIGKDKYKKADIDALFLPAENEKGLTEQEVRADEEAEASRKAIAAEQEKEATKAKAPAKKATKKKAAAKKKAAPKKEVEVPEEKPVADLANHSTEDEDILTMVEETDDICALAKECMEDSAIMEWRLGGVLHHVLDGKAYEALSDSYTGRGGFERYCIAELGIQYRKARHLINIYVEFSNAGLGGNDLARIGWTKGRNLIKVLTPDNAQDMLSLAESNTVESLIDEIKVMEENTTPDKTETTTEKGETVKKVSLKFHYYEDQASFITQSMQQVMDLKGYETEAEALYEMCTGYMTEVFSE